ncbi:MAG: hydrolase [Gammaproteobacteria bacterium]|nr:hydrolase [Gammaproteobacteria bacterium]
MGNQNFEFSSPPSTSANNHSPGFKPAWWLSSRHLQTLWPTLVRRAPEPPGASEWFQLPDGDRIKLRWSGGYGEPIVLFLHGLEGSANSNYLKGMVHAAAQRNWRTVVMHFRGCAGVANTRDRGYHSGETTDLDAVVTALRQRAGSAPIFVVGFSLGGNVLLKWLGEQGERAPINAACAISVPFLLDRCATKMDRGFSRVYQWWLIRSMRKNLMRKFDGRACPVDYSQLTDSSSFWEFDDTVTAPLHGFEGVDDYYQRASSRQYLRNIARPTLVIHSRDDPFMTPDVIPQPHDLSAHVELEVSRSGGHVGFVSGAVPGRARYWLEERIPSFLIQHLWAGM